jgi:hypothetical protein
MMEALSSSETSVLARATLPNNAEDGILQIKRLLLLCKVFIGRIIARNEY